MKSFRRISLALIAVVFLIVSGCASTLKRSAIEDKAVDATMRGSEAFERKDYPAALVKFESSLQYNRAVDNRQGEVLDLINIARVYVALGAASNASDRIEKAILLASRLKDAKILGEAYATKSKILSMSGDNQEAIRAVDQAIANNLKLGIKSGAMMNLKANLLIDTGAVKKAEEILYDALSLNKRDENTVETANSYRGLARAGEAKKTWNDALSFYQSAYDIDKTSGDSLKIATDLVGIADSTLALERREEAVFFYQRAYIVAANAGLDVVTIKSLDRLIGVYRAMGNEEKAASFMKIRESMDAGDDAGNKRVK